MDPKDNVNPTAPDDEQPTTPQTNTQPDAMPSLGSEEPAQNAADPSTDTTAPAPPQVDSDSTAPAASDTPSTTPDTVGMADTQPSIASETPATPAPDMTPPPAMGPNPDPGMPVQPGEPVPPVAPAPTPGNDKKTIMVLGVVAAVLLVAIAVLYFVA